jgi:hypothetical protein
MGPLTLRLKKKKLVRQLKCKSTPLGGVAGPHHDDTHPDPY